MSAWTIIFLIFLSFDLGLRLTFETKRFLEPLEGKELERFQKRLGHVFQGGLVSFGFIIMALSILSTSANSAYPFELIGSSLLFLFTMLATYPFIKKRRIGLALQYRLFGYAIFVLFTAISIGLSNKAPLELAIHNSTFWIFLGYAVFLLEPVIKNHSAISSEEGSEKLLSNNLEVFDEQLENIVKESNLDEVVDSFKRNIWDFTDLGLGKAVLILTTVLLLFIIFISGLFMALNFAFSQTQTVDQEWNNSVQAIYYINNGEEHEISPEEPEFKRIKKSALLTLQGRPSTNEDLSEYCEPYVDKNNYIRLETNRELNITVWDRKMSDPQERTVSSDKFYFHLETEPLSATCLEIEGVGFFKGGQNLREIKSEVDELSASDFEVGRTYR